jgi:hypothetical protein
MACDVLCAACSVKACNEGSLIGFCGKIKPGNNSETNYAKLHLGCPEDRTKWSTRYAEIMVKD